MPLFLKVGLQWVKLENGICGVNDICGTGMNDIILNIAFYPC